MTKVVIVGEIYNADLSIGGGPIYPTPRPPSGPVDPGYSPPWARPGTGPVDPGWSGGIAPVDPGWGVTPPVDPGYGNPWGGPRPSHPIYYPPGIWGPNDPRPSPPIYIPPQAPPVDPEDPTKAYLVAYVPKSGGGYERITFSVEIPPPTTPTEPTPKA